MEKDKGGRPAVYGARLKRTSVTLPVEYIEHLKTIGNGNISNAIRMLIKQVDSPSEKPPQLPQPRPELSAPRPVYIYGLCDPGSATIRYVGKTVNPKSRLAQHLYKKRQTVYGMNPCAAWIDELKRSEKRPDLIILEETTEEEWEQKEREWIKTLIDQGSELLNVSAGGLSGQWIKTYTAYSQPPITKED